MLEPEWRGSDRMVSRVRVGLLLLGGCVRGGRWAEKEAEELSDWPRIRLPPATDPPAKLTERWGTMLLEPLMLTA